ncbi:hypothetical protein, partial [Escherichia fergusonii]|uniref:hypothetical protein n=1 Tax=Escherichia fergusonii TaxID=564 RepID=UPI001CC0CD95
MKGQLRKNKPRRLVIWDRNDEYDAHARQVASLAEFARCLAADRFAVRYVPRGRTKKQLAAEFE